MKRSFSFPHSLGTKLSLLLVLLLTLVLVVTLLNMNLFSRQIDRNLRDHAIQVSDLIKGSTHDCMLRNDRSHLESIITKIGEEHGIEGIWIYNKYGEVKFTSKPADLHKTIEKDAEQCSFCHTAEEARGTIPRENRIRRLRSDSGDRVLGLINPIESSPSCSSATACHAHSPDEKLLGLLDIQLSLRDVDASAAATRRTVLLISALLVVLTGLLFRTFIQRYIQRPISALIQGTREIAAMKLDTTIPVLSRDELGFLSQSFNNMTKELKRSNEAIQSWSETLQEKVNEKTEELERAQAYLILVEKMASLGKLAGVVAHEINNPMSGILTYSTLLIKNLSSSPSEEEVRRAVESLKVIRDEAKRCGDIVKNLLAFSKRKRSDMAEHDLRPVIARSIELSRHTVKTKAVTLEQKIETDRTMLHCDGAAIEQMILVFLMNAVEAVPPDAGAISILLRDGVPGETLVLEISDNGEGIAEQHMPHIFEPYYTTKDAAENTGLGLTVAFRIIVDQHHGKVSVRSKPGEGTTFLVELPLAQPDSTFR